jgi:gliding motility-associated-like protein
MDIDKFIRRLFFIFLFIYTNAVFAQIKCNNWLSTPARYSYVDIGNLNVPGNSITVEAIINRTQPYVSGTGDNIEGDIVSKHDNPNDVNYLLRPNHAAITTSNGYFVTPDIEDIQLNKTYHVAMVYDGTVLKLYRNGCLMSEVAATGDLFQNSWDTRIGYYQNQIWNTNFIGYINEVRIWNVARTQNEIRAYMNTSLPNPTTQTGLLAYYSFDNLKNKQGNSSWDGSLGGSATVNNTNPNCNSINDLCNSNCSDWLKTSSVPSYVGIGQLNVPGNHITVEAVFNRTAPYSGGQVWAGDIVSKHRDPNDVNYLLRPNSGEITTTNGYYKTPDIADINLNQTYHVAMVYDGDTLKFYRDGCLMSKIHATGDLFQNSWETRIGYYAPQLYPNENFIGYINEVRIWNVARTQAQIQTYMNSSLPNPSTQPGLLAYYTFDDLKNKQGNTAWDGTLGGSASINQTNPNCNAIVNNCPVPPPVCNIVITKRSDTSICKGSSVNSFAKGGTNYQWAPTTGLDNANIPNPVATPSATTTYYVTVSNADGCSKKDSVKITVNALPVIKKSNDTSICINSKVPLFASGGSSYAWSPSTGLENPNSSKPLVTPLVTTKYYVTVTNTAGCKKEDSVKITVNNVPVISKSNDTTICMNSKVPLFATGGTSYSWSPSTGLNNINSSSPLASPLATTTYYVTVSNGGCAKKDSVKITVNSLPVISKSNDTSVCVNSKVALFVQGGSSYSWTPSAGLNNTNISTPIASPAFTTKYYVTVSNTAGCSKKDSVKIIVNDLPIISKSNDTSICANSTISLFATGGTSYSWSPSTGLNNIHSSKPFATPLATTKYYVTVSNGGCSKKDSVNIIVKNLPVISKSSDTSVCINSVVSLFATGGTAYSWLPSTGLDNNQIANPVASAKENTTYYLAVKNAAGCIKLDSVKIKVNSLPSILKSNDTSICINSTAQLFSSGGTSYNWFPATGLDNTTISNPKASPSSTTQYYLTVANSAGCTKKDSVKITVNSLPSISKSNDTSICINSKVNLFASGGTSYNWSPVSSLDNSSVANPLASPSTSTIYHVKVTTDKGCAKTDSVIIYIKPLASITTSNDTTICGNASAKIFATGGRSYAWSPSSTLDNSNNSSPIASPVATTVYYVNIKDQYSCVYKDSVKISVRPPAAFSVSADEQICQKTNQQLNASGGDTYTWSPANSLDNANANNPIASPDQTTTYSVTIKENACNDSATLFTTLTVLPKPNVKAEKLNDISCTQPSTQLTALGALEYSWTPSSGLDNPAIRNPTATPQSSTVYTVIGKDQNGCSNSDSILVKVKYDTNIFYGLPNSFTPNNDGLNDCFGVEKWDQVDQLDLSIYNRWGQRVFHTNNSSSCWDGSLQGQPQDAGVFVYIVKAKTACGNIDRKGTVTLLR